MPLDLEAVRRRLPGRDVEWHAVVDSTMTVAREQARSGYAAGAVVGADRQTAGVGRHGHAWYSEPDAGLYVSVLLGGDADADFCRFLTLAAGLAVREAIEAVGAVRCDLRWPNDVLIGDRKCAGILIASGAGLVAGIGINVNHVRFPAELAATATSLRIATGRSHSREDLLVATLESLDRHTTLLAREGGASILRAFEEASSYARGRRVVVDQDDGVLEGVTGGLDSSGFLILRDNSGASSLIVTGGVRPA